MLHDNQTITDRKNLSDRHQTVARSFGACAEDYDAHTSLQKHVANSLAAHLPDHHAPHILEIGCGTGHFTQSLLEHYPSATGLISDLSPDMLDQCRSKFAERTNLRFTLLNGEEPLSENRYNIIASSMCVHWFTDPLLGLAKLQSLLTKDGVLLYAVPSPKNFAAWYKHLNEQGLSAHIPPAINWPGIVAEEEINSNCDTPLRLLRSLKHIGAAIPRQDYKPMGWQLLRHALQSFDNKKCEPLSWHIVYGKLGPV